MVKRFFAATIGKRLIFFIVSVVLLPTAIVFALFYGQFYNIIQESLLESQVVTSLQAAKFIDNTAQTLLSVCNTIISDERLPVLLSSNAFENEQAGRQNRYTEAQSTLGAIINSHERSNALSAIRIYSDVSAISAIPQSSDLVLDISEIRHTYWYGIFVGSNIDTLFAPEFFLSAAERERYGSLAVIRKQNFIVDGTQVTVFVAVYTYDDILVTPIKDIGMESVEGIISFILNSRDTVVAQTDDTAYGMYAMNFADIALHIPEQGVFIQRDVAGTNVFMTYRDIGSTDWRMAWIVPQASITAQSRHVILQFVVIYIVMTVLVLIIGITQSRVIVKRIKYLRNQMRQIKTERPKPLALLRGRDEVGELIETYNYMVERINNLLDDTIEAAEELRNEEQKALRAQVDPHFLYNTLDMIKWLIKAGSNEKASEAIIALSRFYRLTLYKGDPTASVAAELENVSLYIKLMNMRFDEKIEYLIDMPEEMLEYEVPLIIFQPIVENAIQHGIFEKPSKSGKIIITGWSDEDTLYFMVSDDGIGMTAEQMSALMDFDTGAGASSGIGVYNTHRRLQLMCGSNKYGLYYSSQYGKGTNVTLRIRKGL
jgi:two-component system sensor histidine kinase YesM